MANSVLNFQPEVMADIFNQSGYLVNPFTGTKQEKVSTLSANETIERAREMRDLLLRLKNTTIPIPGQPIRGVFSTAALGLVGAVTLTSGLSTRQQVTTQHSNIEWFEEPLLKADIGASFGLATTIAAAALCTKILHTMFRQRQECTKLREVLNTQSRTIQRNAYLLFVHHYDLTESQGTYTTIPNPYKPTFTNGNW